MSKNDEMITLGEFYNIVINSSDMNDNFIVFLNKREAICRVTKYLVMYTQIDDGKILSNKKQKLYNIFLEKSEVLDIINPYVRRNKLDKICQKIVKQ